MSCHEMSYFVMSCLGQQMLLARGWRSLYPSFFGGRLILWRKMSYLKMPCHKKYTVGSVHDLQFEEVK